MFAVPPRSSSRRRRHHAGKLNAIVRQCKIVALDLIAYLRLSDGCHPDVVTDLRAVDGATFLDRLQHLDIANRRRLDLKWVCFKDDDVRELASG